MLIRAFTLALAALAPASACRSQQTVRNHVRALSIREVRTPPLRVPNYQTSGTYIQISGEGERFRAVNAALRAAVLADQRSYARLARREEAETGSNAVNYPYPGTYKTAPNRRLVSASSEVVSALILTLRLYPGGNDGATWIAATIRVPSGSRVRLGGLFANPSEGLAALARSVRSKVVSENACVRQSIGAEREIGLTYNLRGFDPKPAHYRYFAP